MPPLPQPEPSHRRHQRLADKLSKCIHYIKTDGGFKAFSDFMTGLFTELPTDGSSATDSAYQTVTQTVRAFLKWGPLKGFLDKVSSHPLMAEGGNTRGTVPFYSVSPVLSPGVPTSEGAMLSLSYQYSLSNLNMEAMA